jgi:transposase-like protein
MKSPIDSGHGAQIEWADPEKKWNNGKPTRKYSPEFKGSAVREVTENSRTVNCHDIWFCRTSVMRRHGRGALVYGC